MGYCVSYYAEMEKFDASSILAELEKQMLGPTLQQASCNDPPPPGNRVPKKKNVVEGKKNGIAPPKTKIKGTVKQQIKKERSNLITDKQDGGEPMLS